MFSVVFNTTQVKVKEHLDNAIKKDGGTLGFYLSKKSIRHSMKNVKLITTLPTFAPSLTLATF